MSSVSNAHQLGTMLSLYTETNDGRFPAFFPPTHVPTAAAMPAIEFGEITQPGFWWSNTSVYFHAFGPVSPEVLQSPNSPRRWGNVVGGPGGIVTDYPIADCLYAAPTYWTHDGQRGPEQWSPQRWSGIRHPSGKGLIRQAAVWHDAALGPAYPACCTDAVRSAVLWSDLSGTIEIQARLRPGVANLFWPDKREAWRWEQGPPIRNTERGILGRDKP